MSRKDYLRNKKKGKETTKQLILRKLMKAGACLEPELISEVARELAVQEDTVKRELRSLLNKKAIELGVFSDGKLRRVAYCLPNSRKTKREPVSEQDRKQRTLSEFSKN